MYICIYIYTYTRIHIHIYACVCMGLSTASILRQILYRYPAHTRMCACTYARILLIDAALTHTQINKALAHTLLVCAHVDKYIAYIYRGMCQLHVQIRIHAQTIAPLLSQSKIVQFSQDPFHASWFAMYAQTCADKHVCRVRARNRGVPRTLAIHRRC